MRSTPRVDTGRAGWSTVPACHTIRVPASRTPYAATAAPAYVMRPVVRRFVLHWGEMGTRWGINRTVAQVHALLGQAAFIGIATPGPTVLLALTNGSRYGLRRALPR